MTYEYRETGITNEPLERLAFRSRLQWAATPDDDVFEYFYFTRFLLVCYTVIIVSIITP